jgi:8-oxo-dGTP diphosphatase
MNFRAYLESLPKKRMAAGGLFFNAKGKILILKPTYREYWSIPGGVIEANESPRQAFIREVQEEIGIECQPGRLLCIDYISESESNNESVQFVFFGGVITKDDIKIANDEISDYQFLEPEKGLSLLGIYSQRRIGKCLESLDRGITLYLEDQQEK